MRTVALESMNIKEIDYLSSATWNISSLFIQLEKQEEITNRLWNKQNSFGTPKLKIPVVAARNEQFPKVLLQLLNILSMDVTYSLHLSNLLIEKRKMNFWIFKCLLHSSSSMNFISHILKEIVTEEREVQFFDDLHHINVTQQECPIIAFLKFLGTSS